MTDTCKEPEDNFFQVDRKKAEQTFLKFTEQYNISDEKIRLKAEHTYRVAELCQKIAESIGLNQDERDLAWLMGLLHDIGRFEQVRRFGTFNDAKSIDHAACSADFLFLEGRIRDYTRDDRQDKLIESAVRCHNAFQIPEDCDERTRLYASLLRDADKIDILKVNYETRLEEIYDVTEEEVLYSAVSDDVMKNFWEEHAIPRNCSKTPVDHLVGHISLIYELVFPVSKELVRQQGFLQKIMDFESKNPKTKEDFRKIRRHMNKYLGWS